MRLRRLCLERFGHFTGRDFDFGAAGDGPDFHIVHGPNEAGKTTTMEGALRLFYGFPHREAYDFRHQRKNLRVSAVVEIDGAARHLTRLPLRSGALVDETGTALPEAALAAHLGGLGEEDYRNLLCLDDDTIERGGEEIARARGDIGRLLFSAAAGVAELGSALDAVRAEADAIWGKRKSKTRVAELKRSLAQVEKEMRAHDISASAWRGLKKALAEAKAHESGAREARDGLQHRAAMLAAERRALPQVDALDALEARLAPFAEWPERLDFDPEGLVALVAEDSRARADAARLDAEIEEMPGSTRTAVDAAAAVGCDVAQIVKSLLFAADDGRVWLVLASGPNRVDPALLELHVGSTPRLADPATVRDVTGFAIGGVAPVGLANEVPVLMDQDLLAYDVVWAAAGTPKSVFPVDPAELRDAIRATVVAVTSPA